MYYFYLKYGMGKIKYLLNVQSGLVILGFFNINEEIDNVFIFSICICEIFVYECFVGQVLNMLVVVMFFIKIELLKFLIVSYSLVEEQKG